MSACVQLLAASRCARGSGVREEGDALGVSEGLAMQQLGRVIRAAPRIDTQGEREHGGSQRARCRRRLGPDRSHFGVQRAQHHMGGLERDFNGL